MILAQHWFLQKLLQIHIAYYLAYTQSWGTLELQQKSEFKLNPFAVSLKLWKQFSFSFSTCFATQIHRHLLVLLSATETEFQ